MLTSSSTRSPLAVLLSIKQLGASEVPIKCSCRFPVSVRLCFTNAELREANLRSFAALHFSTYESVKGGQAVFV